MGKGSSKFVLIISISGSGPASASVVKVRGSAGRTVRGAEGLENDVRAKRRQTSNRLMEGNLDNATRHAHQIQDFVPSTVAPRENASSRIKEQSMMKTAKQTVLVLRIRSDTIEKLGGR